MNDEHLDRAIDEAAHALASGEPAPGFARRVRGRIEAHSARRVPTWQLAAAMTLLVLIVYAVPWSRRERPAAPERPGRASHPAPVVRHTPVPPAAPAVRASAEGRRVPAGRSSSPAVTPRIVIDDAALTLAPLPELRDLSVPIDEPADLTVPPLEIAELTLPPLVPGEKEPR